MSAGKITAGCLVIVILFRNDLSYGYQWGELELKPWASLQEEYDSNITYAHSGVLSDFITAPRIGLDGTYTGKNANAELNLSLEEQIYSRYSQFDNLSEYLSGNYNMELTYYDHLKINENFEHAEDPTNFAEQFGRINGRYQYYDNSVNVDWTHDFTSQLSLQCKFINEYYDPLMQGLQSSVENKPGFEADYELSSQLRLLSYFDYTDREYSNLGNLDKETVGIGLRNYWTPQLFLEGRVGVDFIQPIVGHDTIQPQYLVSLNDQADSRTLYTLSFSKQYEDSPYSEFLFNNWRVGLELKKDLSQRISSYASVFTGDGVYIGQGTKERLTGARVGVIFHATKNMDFRAEYGFSYNGSNVKADTYQKNTALLEVTIKF